MTSNVLCKYYMNGACAYGDQCRFSHNKQEEASQVCKFYLQGNCAYGDKCRYEHSKPSWSSRGQPSGPSNYTAPPAVPKPPVGPPGGIAKLPSGASDLGLTSSGNPNWDDYMTPDEVDEFEAWQAEQQQTGRPGAGGPVDDEFGDIMDPADIPLCNEYAATGFCSAGEDCLYVHGDVCEVCQQHVLHPHNSSAAKEHTDTCSKLAASIAKRRRDAEIECAICFGKVLTKPEMSQRRFGLMVCDHAFCLSCIRNWRSTAEVDTKTALRTCPICRTPTHFITPSTKWPDSPEAKAAIVDAYKASMGQKDCTNFAFGEGSCPFGSSCFYRHAYRDGRLEEVHLRRAGTADGGVKVLGPVSLSSFLEASLTAQLTLSRRPPQQLRQRQRGRQAVQELQEQQQAEIRGVTGSAAAAAEDEDEEGTAAAAEGGTAAGVAGSTASAGLSQRVAEEQL